MTEREQIIVANRQANAWNRWLSNHPRAQEKCLKTGQWITAKPKKLVPLT